MAAVANSILDTTKKALGIDADNKEFDVDIIMHINSTFSILNQLGVGPTDGFAINDSSTLWSAYLQDNLLLNSVKSLMYLQVLVWFDPPGTSFVLTSRQEQLKELQWRINVIVDTKPLPPEPSSPSIDDDSVVVW